MSSNRITPRKPSLLDILGSSSSSSSDEDNSDNEDLSRTRLSSSSSCLRTTTVKSTPRQSRLATSETAGGSTRSTHIFTPAVTGIVVRRRRLPSSKTVSASRSSSHTPSIVSPSPPVNLVVSDLSQSGRRGDALLAALRNPALSKVICIEDEDRRQKKRNTKSSRTTRMNHNLSRSGSSSLSLSVNPQEALSSSIAWVADDVIDGEIDEDPSELLSKGERDDEDPLTGIARAAAEMHESWSLFHKHATPLTKAKSSFRSRKCGTMEFASPSSLTLFASERDEDQNVMSENVKERERMIGSMKRQFDWMKSETERLFYNRQSVNDESNRGMTDSSSTDEGCWFEDLIENDDKNGTEDPLKNCSVFINKIRARKPCSTISSVNWDRPAEQTTENYVEEDDDEMNDVDDDSFVSAEEEDDEDDLSDLERPSSQRL